MARAREFSRTREQKSRKREDAGEDTVVIIERARRVTVTI